MDAKQNFFDLHVERFRLFESQDLENGDFDVVFDFNGQKLYANKLILTTVSTTFKSMLSNRWRKTDEPITVTDYSFNDFKEFLTFIYSGECLLTKDNIFSMVDMAEFYGIRVLKYECGKFLANMELNLENIYEMLNLAIRYSFSLFKYHIKEFISKNFSKVTKDDQFQNLQKSTLQFIVELNSIVYEQEELFEAVYNWAENQALKKQKVEPNLNLNETIKAELTEILPLIKFETMNAGFLLNFVGKKSFLFSDDELKNILSMDRKVVYVKVVNKNGRIMKGQLQCDNIEQVVDVIESKKERATYYELGNYYFWNTRVKKPGPSSKLIKTEKCEWYLIYDKWGDLAIKRRNQLIDEADFLLAEMEKENRFVFDKYCKIEICRSE